MFNDANGRTDKKDLSKVLYLIDECDVALLDNPEEAVEFLKSKTEIACIICLSATPTDAPVKIYPHKADDVC